MCGLRGTCVVKVLGVGMESKLTDHISSIVASTSVSKVTLLGLLGWQNITVLTIKSKKRIIENL